MTALHANQGSARHSERRAAPVAAASCLHAALMHRVWLPAWGYACLRMYVISASVWCPLLQDWLQLVGAEGLSLPGSATAMGDAGLPVGPLHASPLAGLTEEGRLHGLLALAAADTAQASSAPSTSTSHLQKPGFELSGQGTRTLTVSNAPNGATLFPHYAARVLQFRSAHACIQ